MRHRPGPLLCLTGLLIIGCDEEPEIEVYRAPADPPVAGATVTDNPHAGMGGPMAGGGTMATSMSDRRLITWDLPEGWSIRPVAGPMRSGTLASGVGPDALEVSVATAGGGLMANVARWWRLLGHAEPPTGEQLQQMITPLEGHALEAVLVDLPGAEPEGDQPRMRTLAGVVEHEGTLWFFTVTDTDARLDRHGDAVRAIVRSVRPVKPPATRPAPAAQTPASRPGLGAPATRPTG